MNPPIAFPKSATRKIDRIKKKTPFRFDPVPSALIEGWLPHLNEKELKILLYICRRTWGFRKAWDAIKMEQFCTGVVDRNGKHLDCGTGLKETCVRGTLRELEKKGLIEVKHRATKANLYCLSIKPGFALYEPQISAEKNLGFA